MYLAQVHMHVHMCRKMQMEKIEKFVTNFLFYSLVQTPTFKCRKYFGIFCQLVSDYVLEPKEAKTSAHSADIYGRVASLWVSCDHMHVHRTSLT